ncbi:hypothetical protein AB870_09320 [Pandoraea faecigallinarum]|uniref:Uncharacterized protein n=1 Tax=Pandoraea faecigallinarum TaxID=656179 RepID=A0A0H3WR23_9BURK|nr:hypothetical protein [Pandoraea faecigallinarum]AKM30257.1 hypothetical protein AB870_09320 [Pandoraea faecigallinarum]
MQLLTCKPLRNSMTTTPLDRQLCPPENGQQFAITRVTQIAPSTNETPLDTPQMAGFWTLAFTMVVGLYVVSAHLGAILGFIRRG